MAEANPYISPAAVSDAPPKQLGSLLRVFANAWKLFSRHFVSIFCCVAIVWLPLHLLESYLEFFVFDADDFRSGYRLTKFFQNFIGIIVIGAVVFIGVSATRGERPGIGTALLAGLQSWPRLWWTRLLTGLAILICLLLLVVPGIYVAIRLCLTQVISVAEPVAGISAMRRSFELTRNKFWYTTGVCIVICVLFSLMMLIGLGPIILVPVLENWVCIALAMFLIDLGCAYLTLCLYCAYDELAELADMAPLTGLA